MPSLNYKFEELELGGGIALASGFAEVDYDYDGSWTVSAIGHKSQAAGTRAVLERFPDTYEHPEFGTMRFVSHRVVVPAIPGKITTVWLEKSDPIYSCIRQAIEEQCSDSIDAAIERDDNDVAKYSRSMSDHAQHSIGKHNAL
jgi:hypothetical protein